jgi:hypothetical protein
VEKFPDKVNWGLTPIIFTINLIGV